MSSMYFAIYQPRALSGRFEEASQRLQKALALCAERAQGAPFSFFAPMGAIEGGIGLDALRFPWVRARYELAVAQVASAARSASAHLFLPVWGNNGVEPMWCGPEGTGFRKLDAPVCLAPGLAVSTPQDLSGSVAWRFDALHQCWNTGSARLEADRRIWVEASLAGGEADQIYVGRSRLSSADETVEADDFEEDLRWVRVETHAEGTPSVIPADGRPARRVVLGDLRFRAAAAAIRDYVGASRSSGIVLGLSGGVDSALVAALAVEALGEERVCALMLKSRFTSEESVRIAQETADGLGIRMEVRTIERLHEAAQAELAVDVGRLPVGDITDQNVQARLRALWLMALSNRWGRLMLCTSNKAESAMGYGTLYGDLAGGFAPIADLWKREVRDLCLDFNRSQSARHIPETVIFREPTAELRPNQRDSDSLPPYDRIERVMRAAMSAEFDPACWGADDLSIVERAASFAFKRRQCPLALRLSETTLADFDLNYGVNRSIFG